jgi:hypothetical protein
MKKEKPRRPEPEEHVPQHRHFSPAKHHEDRNTKYHEVQEKDVARVLVAHPPKPSKGNKSRSTNDMIHADIIVRTQ